LPEPEEAVVVMAERPTPGWGDAGSTLSIRHR
jgi:hypothetical protein